MATKNPFDFLGDVDVEDPSQLAAAQLHKIEVKKTLAPSAKPAVAQPKLPSKSLSPSQAVREARSRLARGGRGGRRGYERGRGSGGGSYRDSSNNELSYGNREITGGQRDAETGKLNERRGAYGGPRGTFHGDQRGGLSNGYIGEGYSERPHRPFEQHSGTGHGSDFKWEGTGEPILTNQPKWLRKFLMKVKKIRT